MFPDTEGGVFKLLAFELQLIIVQNEDDQQILARDKLETSQFYWLFAWKTLTMQTDADLTNHVSSILIFSILVFYLVTEYFFSL